MTLKPPTNYTGSKHLLMSELMKYFPKDVNKFYDVFCGGLSVSMNSDYKNIIANDIISPLIEFYKNLYNASDIEKEIEIIKTYAIPKDSQETFLKVRETFNKTRDPYLFFSLVCSCTNNMMRFNKSMGFNQTFGKRSMNDNTFDKLYAYMNRMKEKNITFLNLSFDELLKGEFAPVESDFVYLDPPYAISEAGYNAIWSKSHDDRLFDIMDYLDSKCIRFLMSNVSEHKGQVSHNIERMRKYNMIELDFNYSKVSREDVGITREVIVKNF